MNRQIKKYATNLKKVSVLAPATKMDCSQSKTFSSRQKRRMVEDRKRRENQGKRRKFSHEAKADMAERWREEIAADPKLTYKVIAEREDLDASSVSKWYNAYIKTNQF